MMPSYDYLFVTHLPAFYKVNLYNQLAKYCSLYVIFIADDSTIRTADFTHKQFDFAYCILNKNQLENRLRWRSIFRLNCALKNISYRKLVVGGWDLLEYWYLVFFHTNAKNCLALESGIFESATTGLRYWLKRFFLSQVSLVFPSGAPHKALLNALKYSGKIKTTLGVGQFNYQERNRLIKPFSGKFLYVGRFAPEKNLLLLLQVFAKMDQYTLTLVGKGPLRDKLLAFKTDNVIIKDHIPNELLGDEYLQHDVFILPSLREPWGLVVEEALFYGLPVIVSNQVGCAQDLVQDPNTGILFAATDPDSLQHALNWTEIHYQTLKANVAKMDFKTRDKKQVQQYLEALS